VSSPRQRAVLLDRDGTIIIDHGFLGDPDRVELLPGAAAGLRRLHQRGHLLVIVSNQSGIGRGRISVSQVAQVNAKLAAVLHAAGAPADGSYYCPHAPEDRCSCRKPGIALVTQAARELGFDPANAVVIGDKSSDVELGQRLGAVTMLVSADGRASDGLPATPDFVVPDLTAAAAIIETLDAPGSARSIAS
jgi:D-glycero-D-manno-heptose 1,7-bisphosphate phosphatase